MHHESRMRDSSGAEGGGCFIESAAPGVPPGVLVEDLEPLPEQAHVWWTDLINTKYVTMYNYAVAGIGDHVHTCEPLWFSSASVAKFAPYWSYKTHDLVITSCHEILRPGPIV